jgi:lipopolysaccharide export system protein LptC
MAERFASWFAVLMMLIVLVSSYWYAQTLRNQASGDSGRIGQVDFFAEKIALTGFDVQGRGHYRLFADHLTHFGNTDDVDLTNPRLMSMRTDQPQVQATARNAHVHNNGETVQMRDDVVVTRAADGNRPPMRLDTEELFAAPDDDHFWTDAPVQMRSGEAVMHGVGMDFNNIEQRVELHTQVTGNFPPRSKP